MSAIETLNEIRRSVESIKSGHTQRFSVAASDGDCFRQGDIYVTFRESIPDGCERSDAVSQLAPGTTKGSRHILDSLDGIDLYAKKNPNALDGPVLKTSKERTITHPEHGDVVIPPGVYEITYQRAMAKELKRVAD